MSNSASGLTVKRSNSAAFQQAKLVFVVDHINSNIYDWRACNLEWVTVEENIKRAKLLRVLRSIGRDPKQMPITELIAIFAKYEFGNPTI